MFGFPFPQGVYFINISPLDDPWRFGLFLLPVIYLGFNAWQLLRRVQTGATLVMREGQPLSLRIFPGKVLLSKTQKNKKIIASYNGPVSAALLGLLFFMATQSLIVMLFLQPVYIY